MQIKKNEIPPGWSLEAADFINKLLQRKPANRLGLNGPGEVKGHQWLKDFQWQELHDKKTKAPFIPNVTSFYNLQDKEDNFDFKNSNENWKDENSETLRQNSVLLRRNSVQALFNGYYYDSKLTTNTASTLINAQSSGGAASSQSTPPPQSVGQ